MASPSKKWKRGCFLRAAGSGWGQGLGRPSNSQPPGDPGAGEKPHCRGARSHGTRCHTSRSYPPHRPAEKRWNGQASGVEPLKPHGGMLGKSTGSHHTSFGGDLLICWKRLGTFGPPAILSRNVAIGKTWAVSRWYQDISAPKFLGTPREVL